MRRLVIERLRVPSVADAVAVEAGRGGDENAVRFDKV
jgi:hypothetical protein